MSGKLGYAPEGKAEGPVFGGGIGALNVGAEPGVVEGWAGDWTFGVVDGAAAGTLSGPSLLGTGGRLIDAVGIDGIAGAADGTAATFVGKAGAGIWLLGIAGVGPGAGPLV